MELMVRISSYDSAVAAVQAGAHELLLTLPIPANDMRETLQFARSRGIRTVLDYTWPCPDDELLRRAKQLEALYSLGLNGVMVADAGHLRMVRMMAPECSLEWGAPCQTLEEIRFAASQKCVRAFLSPFIAQNELLQLCSESPIPLMAMVFGPLCPAGDPNRCLLDTERGQYGCRQSCRGEYGYGDKPDGALLLARDLCLLSYRVKLSGLRTGLVVSPDPAPEPVAFFTRICRSVLVEREPFHKREIQEAMAALGRPGVTDAPFAGQGEIYAQNFTPGEKNKGFWDAKQIALTTEREQNTIPLRFFALINRGAPARLAVDDYKGHTIYVTGPVPSPSETPMREAEANTQWYKTGGMYRCEEARTRIDPGVRITMVDMSRMRAEALRQLTQARQKPPERKSGEFAQGMVLLPRADIPVVTVRVARMPQITAELLETRPERLYIPLSELISAPEKAKALLNSPTVPVVILPRVVREKDKPEIMSHLGMLYGFGYREALVFTYGQIALCAEAGYSARADWCASDSQTLKAAKALGVLSCSVASWLTFEEIQSMCHVLDTELPGYGRIPLLHAQSCLVKPKRELCSCDNHNEIIDGQGGYLPLMRDCGHTTMVFHSHKLWLGGVEKYWKHIGLWAVSLEFTTENPRECVQVTRGYMNKEPYTPHTHTTGFYLTAEKIKSAKKK